MDLESFFKNQPEPPDEFCSQLDPLSTRDVLSTYFFDGFAGIDDSLTMFEWTTQGDELGWNLLLFHTSGACVNAIGVTGPLPIMRKLHPRIPLRGVVDVTARVGHNLLICLDRPFRGLGIGSAFDQRERELFRKWGAKELHLEAGCDALRNGTWLRKGYKPSFTEQLALEELWHDYQMFDEHKPAAKMTKLPKSWANWPEGFRNLVCTQPNAMQLYLDL